ncbi:MAG: type II secretion system F family protein [Planctomycetota bacterium]|nr:type II secretion system F family protein [Planctomycetota bacterium]
MSDQTLLLGLAAASVAALAYFVTMLLFRSDDEQKLRSRLQGKAENSTVEKKPASGMAPILQQIGQAASKPFMPSTREKQSEMRNELGKAGIYSPSAIAVVKGCKFIFLSAGIFGGYAVSLMIHKTVFCVPIGGLIGYMLPTLWMRSKIKGNQKALEYGLADALDLMVVCVEAGLTVDSAMQRVGDELALVHPALSREFSIAHMETRVGLARQEALRNMGHRTANASLMSLAAMLNQADRFGTSIAAALRIHAETLRLTRQHKAEEMAAKSSVKMSFPLVLFIFPATFMVLMGPVVIKLMNSELMK